MNEKITKYNTGYTQVINIVLYDSTISLRAKGMYAYLFSKPEGWCFHIDSMCGELKESRGHIYSAIKELIEAGLIKRYQLNEKGVFGGIVYEFIDLNDRLKSTPCTEKSAYGKTLTHNNTDIISKTDNIRKEIYKEKFEEFWKEYPKQRAGSKEKAYKSYCKTVVAKKITSDKLLDIVKKYARSEEVKRGFAKGCAAWLNDERFNNEDLNKISTFNMEDWLNEQD